MIRGKGNLGFNYWSNHQPNNFEITPWERQQLREYFVQDLGMIPEQELDFQMDTNSCRNLLLYMFITFRNGWNNNNSKLNHRHMFFF